MAASVVSRAFLVSNTPGQERGFTRLESPEVKKRTLSWTSSFSATEFPRCCSPTVPRQSRQVGIACAAWTRRSKSALDPPNKKKSWGQRHDKYMKPFMLDVFISSKYVHAKVVHRVTSHTVAVATTSSKDLRLSLRSLSDDNACRIIGKRIAEQAIEADVFAVKFELRKNERYEGRLALVVNTMVENGVAVY